MPERQHVALGFDFGTQRIGVAVGQTVTQTARPLTIIPVRKSQPDWMAIEALIQQWHPTVLVVGLPLDKDGSEQAVTKAARQFAEALNQRFQLPVEQVDERYSSVAARSVAREQSRSSNERIDDLAAQIILQDWLQRQR